MLKNTIIFFMLIAMAALAWIALHPKAAVAVQPAQQASPQQPDTSARNWKLLTSDPGIWITAADGVYRGRLYTLADGKWVPVAADGLTEITGGIIPAR